MKSDKAGDFSEPLNSVSLVWQALLENVKDPLSEWLDAKLGASISDNSIFFDLPKHYEGEYFTDMERLNVSWARLVFVNDSVSLMIFVRVKCA